MADFLHTMVRITDPEKSRSFYEALGCGSRICFVCDPDRKLTIVN